MAAVGSGRIGAAWVVPDPPAKIRPAIPIANTVRNICVLRVFYDSLFIEAVRTTDQLKNKTGRSMNGHSERNKMAAHVIARAQDWGKFQSCGDVPGCRINPLHIRRLWDPVAGSCHSAPARANKSWSRYRRPKTERSCIEAYPGKDARTRQTKLLIPIWRTRPSYDRGCQRLLGIFLIHHIERTERSPSPSMTSIGPDWVAKST